MLNPYSILHISFCVKVIYFTFFVCERGLYGGEGGGGGKGTLSKGTKEVD